MRRVLDINVAVSSYREVAEKSIEWAKRGESRAIFFANVHMLMEAHDDLVLRDEINAADMINPDGVPLVWALRILGERQASRVYGPDATGVLLGEAQDAGIPIALYGGSEATMGKLISEITRLYPRLAIVYTLSPPFRALSAAEDDAIVNQIIESGARMVFVGLGCPKQERWIIAHRGRIPAVMFGVGAAFDFLAGTKPQAPRWMMRNGLEWVFRFVTEPRRLAGRYLKHNPRFVGLVFQQWLSESRSKVVKV